MKSSISNRSIAKLFNELASLMEFHGENAFKIRSYSRAYNVFRNLAEPLAEMSSEDISALPQIGAAITSKVQEIKDKGTFDALERYREQTPPGIRELLSIRGLGVKKIKSIVTELQVSDPGELLYACHENRLIQVKGFGAKSQATVRQALEYWQASKGKLRLPDAEMVHDKMLEIATTTGVQLDLVGDLVRWNPVIDELSYVVTDEDSLLASARVELMSREGSSSQIRIDGEHLVTLLSVESDRRMKTIFEYRGQPEFVDRFRKTYPHVSLDQSEETIFAEAGMPYVPAESRESFDVGQYQPDRMQNLITEEDLQGAVHNHTTWSDGNASVKEMAQACLEMGLSYLGLCDHSQSAFYANGLKPHDVVQQWQEIDSINQLWNPSEFKIFKGIESDILSDGSLDYESDILEGFDFVVASIHSHLRMDESAATQRLLKAIENPYTRILGHPTGRLLLSRKGYPIDHEKVIEACAQNNVVLELNANPMRLDLDWKWIDLALSKGVLISINPDAHNVQGLRDMRYGVMVARKALLPVEACLNALSLAEFERWCDEK